MERKGEDEWLLTNASGSFALGTVDRTPRRKYHGLLTLRDQCPGDPINALADVGEWVSVGDEVFVLHSLRRGEVQDPDGGRHLVDFEPTPTWRYQLGELRIERTLAMHPELPAIEITYRVEGVSEPVGLALRPLLRMRSLHHLASANTFLDGSIETRAGHQVMHPYADLPELFMKLDGAEQELVLGGSWIEGVTYEVERLRGYPDVEDLFGPGEYRVRLEEDATLRLWFGAAPRPNADGNADADPIPPSPLPDDFDAALDRACEAYTIRLRDYGPSVIAGYPWFGEWGRDALISLPGLYLARGRAGEALELLESLAARREGGLIPNMPASAGNQANCDSVDASLFFVRCVRLARELVSQEGTEDEQARALALMPVACDLLEALADGADARVRVDDDGGLFIEEGAWGLTWMDAKVDGWPVTPRWGFPVDMNALFLDGLTFTTFWAATERPEYAARFQRALTEGPRLFRERFWLEDEGYLSDTHDGSRPDGKLRPNQCYALNVALELVSREQAARALAAVKKHLLTPVGLRTLSPEDPDYVPTYEGSQPERDRAYHQGTVWTWLLGPYFDALAHVHGLDRASAEFAPVLARLEHHFRDEGCIGQISEIFDAAPPHAPRGAPAQAWSVAEVLRIVRSLSK